MGEDTVILDVSNTRLAYSDDIFGSRITPIYSDPGQVEKYVREADVVIGGVLIPGANAPKLVSEKLISEMQEGSVAVDAAVDQGGCIETRRPTPADHSSYPENGVVPYSPASTPAPTTQPLTVATDYALK